MVSVNVGGERGRWKTRGKGNRSSRHLFPQLGRGCLVDLGRSLCSHFPKQFHRPFQRLHRPFPWSCDVEPIGGLFSSLATPAGPCGGAISARFRIFLLKTHPTAAPKAIMVRASKRGCRFSVIQSKTFSYFMIALNWISPLEYGAAPGVLPGAGVAQQPAFPRLSRLQASVSHHWVEINIPAYDTRSVDFLLSFTRGWVSIHPGQATPPASFSNGTPSECE